MGEARDAVPGGPLLGDGGVRRDDGAGVVAAYDCSGGTFGVEGGVVGGVEGDGGGADEEVAGFEGGNGEGEEGGGAG